MRLALCPVNNQITSLAWPSTGTGRGPGNGVYMNRLLLTLPLLVASVASAQQIPVGRVLVVDGVSAVVTPLNPPPPLVGALTVPEQFVIYGLLVSVGTQDGSVCSFQIETRVETAGGERINFHANIQRDPARDWVTQIFYTGKDPVVKVLTLTIIPLQRSQIKTFQAEPTD